MVLNDSFYICNRFAIYLMLSSQSLFHHDLKEFFYKYCILGNYVPTINNVFQLFIINALLWQSSLSFICSRISQDPHRINYTHTIFWSRLFTITDRFGSHKMVTSKDNSPINQMLSSLCDIFLCRMYLVVTEYRLFCGYRDQPAIWIQM